MPVKINQSKLIKEYQNKIKHTVIIIKKPKLCITDQNNASQAKLIMKNQNEVLYTKAWQSKFIMKDQNEILYTKQGKKLYQKMWQNKVGLSWKSKTIN